MRLQLPASANQHGAEERTTAVGVHCGAGRGARASTIIDLRKRPNVRAKRATTAGRQARAGENVPRTTGPGLVACRWRSA